MLVHLPAALHAVPEQRVLRVHALGHGQPVLPSTPRYEPKPIADPNPYAEELRVAQKQKTKLIRALVYCPVGQDKSAMLTELDDLEVIELDCQQMMSRSRGMGTLTAPLGG
mgnify:CR=1 FL=1